MIPIAHKCLLIYQTGWFFPLLIVFFAITYEDACSKSSQPTGKSAAQTVQCGAEKLICRLIVNQDCTSDSILIDIGGVEDSVLYDPSIKGDTIFLVITEVGSARVRTAARASGADAFHIAVCYRSDTARFRVLNVDGRLSVSQDLRASFVVLQMPVSLPREVLWIQFDGNEGHGDAIKKIAASIKGMAEITQLEDGLYDCVASTISKVKIRRWCVNENATGTILFVRLSDATFAKQVTAILDEYQ